MLWNKRGGVAEASNKITFPATRGVFVCQRSRLSGSSSWGLGGGGGGGGVGGGG